ncbi:cytochrome P450 [Ahrensia marina]|uniref:cytochrome P450 n=1 Tax=Ahrensia marina TaxID=1514904 RepID=UPI0035CF4028
MRSLPYDSASRRLFIDPRQDAFVQNPYPSYAALHEAGGDHGPVVFWEAYDHWVFGGLNAVNALFRDRRLGRQILHRTTREALGWDAPHSHTADFDAIDARSLLELEPPDHTRLRALINRAFVSRHVEALGPEIAAETNKAMDAFGDAPDLLADFAEPIAGNTIARMLGIDLLHVPQLLAWSHAMVQMYAFGRDRAVEEAANAAARAFTKFVREEIATRRQGPGPDLLTHLITAHEAQDRLTEEEIISTMILLLNAGHEATVHAMGNGLRTLFLASSDERMRWLADPEAMTEEILRHTPPLHMFMRYVLEDCELYGAPFKQGDVIGLHLGLANHDPRAMPAPQRFDPSRVPVKNVAFGAGIHFCIGHTLARLEMATAIPMLFARFPNMHMAETPRFKNAYHFHGLESLSVSL